MQRGMEPDIRKFLLKIVNTVSWVLIWMFTAATAGIYFQLGDPGIHPAPAVIAFYTVLAVTLFFLIRYIYRKWNNTDQA